VGSTTSAGRVLSGGIMLQEVVVTARKIDQAFCRCTDTYTWAYEDYNEWINNIDYTTGSGGGSSTGTNSPTTAVVIDNVEPISLEEFMAELWEATKITLTEDFENDPCTKGVYDALTKNNDAFKMLQGFMGENPVANLTLDLNPTLDPLNIGRTLQQGSEITIEMNSGEFSNQSRLSITQAMLHEFVHGELFYALVSNDADFGTLFDEFANNQHEFMINNYIALMGNILWSIDGGIMDISFYEALSYRGLEDTSYYKANIKGTIEETVIKGLQNTILGGGTPCGN